MIYSQGKKPGGQKKRVVVRLLVVGLGVLGLGGGVLFALDALDIAPLGVRSGDNELLRLWNESDYEAVRATAESILAEHALDGKALTFGGFAEFYTGVELVEQEARRERLDRSIELLRKALHVPRAPLEAERDYVLAKAYFHKGAEYMDLSVYYMERSLERGYDASDSHTYLGLGYARLGLFEQSVDWFERAMERANAEDINAIRMEAARSLVELEDYASARSVLEAAVATLEDEFLVLMARNELASVLILDEQYETAESVLEATIERFPESADAYYYLGIVYDQTDRDVQARGLWRTAREIDPNHTEALQLLANWGG